MPLSLRIALVLLTAALTLFPTQADAAPEEDTGVEIYLAAAGVALLAGGGALAYVQNREADRDMRVYRRSAFSAHTEDYRERVEDHQRLTWAGLAGAALGGILLVVSF